MQGYEIRKRKEWTDEKGHHHVKMVGGWYGNKLFDISPYLIGIALGLIFWMINPNRTVIAIIIGIYIICFTFSMIYDYKMKYIWTEENGWKTTSLPELQNNVRRLYYSEYKGFKIIRELDESSNTYTMYVHDVLTGEHYDYPEKIKAGENSSITQINDAIDWLKQQIDG